MKRVVLIDFSNVYSFSVRHISSYLKSRGHKVYTIHCGNKNDDMFTLMSEEGLKLLLDKCKDCDLIGISLLSTHYLKRATQINDYLKDKIRARIIWGGVPVICDPQFYLSYADSICTGEGEITMCELLTGKDYRDIPGLGYRSQDGEININDAAILLDPNEIPIPYFDLESTFVLKDKRLTSLKENIEPLVSISSKGYRIFPIRGCPYACTFCSNNRLKKAFQGKGAFVRQARPPRIIAELEKAKELVPNLKKIMFYEDDFMVRPEEEIEELLTVYSQKIALPININATIVNLTEKKLDLIINSGVEIEFVKIGLQSASSRVNKEVFKRYFNKETYLEKLEMLAFKGIPVVLDIISDDPYETLNDKYESLLFYRNLSKRIKRSSIINNAIRVMDHKLMFYPGTYLYNRALSDGIIKNDYIEKVLLTRRTTRNTKNDMDNDAFLVALFSLATKKRNIGIPNIIFEVLKFRQIFRFLYRSSIFKFFFTIAYRLRSLTKVIIKR